MHILFFTGQSVAVCCNAGASCAPDCTFQMCSFGDISGYVADHGSAQRHRKSTSPRPLILPMSMCIARPWRVAMWR